MMTFSLVFTAALIGVTSGWAPIEGVEQTAGGYEYVLQITPEDLRALAEGRADQLTSRFPGDVGPFQSVRIVVGTGEPIRQLTEADERSPRRLVKLGAQRQTVGKPIVPDTWESFSPDEPEAAGRPDPESSSTAQRHTVFQNPNQAYWSNQLRSTQNPQTTQYQGAQYNSAAPNTTTTSTTSTNAVVPPPYSPTATQANPYASRPATTSSGTRTVAGWSATTPAASSTTTSTNTTTPYKPYSYNTPTTANPYSSPVAQSTTTSTNSNIATPFGYGDQPTTASTTNNYAPASRGNLNQVGNANTINPTSTTTAASSSAFPPLTSPNTNTTNNNQFRSSFPSSANANTNTPDYRFDVAPSVSTKPRETQVAAVKKERPVTGWNDSFDDEFDEKKSAAEAREERRDRAGATLAGFWPSIVIAGLGGLNVYLWHGYIDTRNKYRSALRRGGASYDHAMAA